MYHSITIGDKNTWDDWHLVAKTRPFFNPPKLKTRYLDVPGASGSVDVSQVLTGYPLYSNREGSIEFMILNLEDIELDNYDYKHKIWIDEYSDIMNYLHSKNLKAVLEDEPEYYYEGQFSVTGYKPGDSASNPRATITISYVLDPYKWYNQRTTEDWIWNTFNFANGVIWPAMFRNIEVNGEVKKTFSVKEIGYAPVQPLITCNPDADKTITVALENKTLNKQLNVEANTTGTIDTKDFIMYGDVEMTLIGNGLVSVDFRTGRL